MKKVLGFIVVLVCCMQSAHADGGRSGMVDVTNARFQLINGNPSRLYIYDVTMANATCDVKTTSVINFDTNALAKEMYSMVLSAKAVGKKVELIANACIDFGGNTYPLISSIYMQ